MRTVLFIAAAAFILAACTGIGPRSTTVTASPPNPKHPKVYVLNNKRLVVDQEPITFFRGDGQNVKIKWKLQTPGYRFTEKGGIDVRAAVSGTAGQITGCTRVPKEEDAFECENANRAPGTFPYKLSVEPIGGGPTITLDPFVVND